VAEFLIWWAVRADADTVLDPSFGGGVFLRGACKRIRELGGSPAAQVFGVELDSVVHHRISEKLHDEFGVRHSHLAHADFFEFLPEHLSEFDVVVVNPPFIRYQRFTGQTRKRALTRAAEQGLKLSELSSSWLPFLIHSLRFLRNGGRLAMVLPFEIGHAAYALPVLGHLRGAFDSITFLAFRKKLFPDLSEDTLLMLAEGRQQSASGRFFIHDLAHAGVLGQLQALGRRRLGGARPMDPERIVKGEQRIIEYLLPRKARELYSRLRVSSATVPLGSLADVGIGYVTGANEFFHPDPAVIAEQGLPSRFLRTCVRRGRALAGLRFTNGDWRQALSAGNSGYLLELPGSRDLPDSVLRYIAEGERQGLQNGFKCRTRTPWYRVPHVYRPDAFLTYMSGDQPRLVANGVGAVAARAPGRDGRAPVRGDERRRPVLGLRDRRLRPAGALIGTDITARRALVGALVRGPADP
jgi:tRNA1(Val) A37 N6-methylase TrmN6